MDLPNTGFQFTNRSEPADPTPLFRFEQSPSPFRRQDWSESFDLTYYWQMTCDAESRPACGRWTFSQDVQSRSQIFSRFPSVFSCRTGVPIYSRGRSFGIVRIRGRSISRPGVRMPPERRRSPLRPTYPRVVHVPVRRRPHPIEPVVDRHRRAVAAALPVGQRPGAGPGRGAIATPGPRRRVKAVAPVRDRGVGRRRLPGPPGEGDTHLTPARARRACRSPTPVDRSFRRPTGRVPRETPRSFTLRDLWPMYTLVVRIITGSEFRRRPRARSAASRTGASARATAPPCCASGFSPGSGAATAAGSTGSTSGLRRPGWPRRSRLRTGRLAPPVTPRG